MKSSKKQTARAEVTTRQGRPLRDPSLRIQIEAGTVFCCARVCHQRWLNRERRSRSNSYGCPAFQGSTADRQAASWPPAGVPSPSQRPTTADEESKDFFDIAARADGLKQRPL